MAKPAALPLVLLLAVTTPWALHAAPALPLPQGCTTADAAGAPAPEGTGASTTFPPPQLEVRTPVAPSVFDAGGLHYLVYELQLLNASESPMLIQALDISGDSADGPRLLRSLSGAELSGALRIIGGGSLDAAQPLPAGRSATAYLCLAFARTQPVPTQLGHRLRLHSGIADGPAVPTRGTRVNVLASPVRGQHWLADNALALDRHHRPGLFVAGGRAQISRRYAIDWKRRIDAAVLHGDPLDVRSYHAYAQPVFAVADAVVVQARDGLPDNVPRTAAGFTPALPLSMDTLAGNTVVLDLGDGQYAHYAHLQPGSVAVKAGQRVSAGQRLARIGNSGDARWPHLHFQVSSGADIMNSEGLPFVIRQFRARDAQGHWTERANEFPLGDGELAFGDPWIR